MLLDFIALMTEVTGGKGFEISPGLQFGGGVKGIAKQGDKVHISLILQNALDTPIDVSVNVILPERRMLKKVNLQTVSNIKVSLKGSEVEQIFVPVKASLDTPEGDYLAEVQIEAFYEKRGNRIRGSMNEVKGEHMALGKSAAASAALSAIGLFFGGRIVVATYSQSDRVILNIKVTGTSENPDPLPLTVIRRQLWREIYNELDPKLGGYIKEMLEKYSRNDLVNDQVALAFTGFYGNLFKSTGFPITDEELLWMGRLMARLTFEAGGFYTINVSHLLLEKIAKMIDEQSELKSKPLQEFLDFEKDILGLWMEEVRTQDNLKWLFADFAGRQMIGSAVSSGKVPREEAQTFFEKTLPALRQSLIDSFAAFKEGRDHKEHLGTAVGTHISWAILESEHLFKDKTERSRYLKSLKDVVPKSRGIPEQKRQTIARQIERYLA